MKLEHVALNVPDPVGAAKWYAENLGLRVVRSMDQSPYIHFLADPSGSMLEMYNDPRARVPDYRTQDPLELHIAFTVDDIDRTRKQLVLAGATAVGEIVTTDAGDQLAFVRDPWNVALQLVKRNQPLRQ